jgi:hypothetical protein
MLGMYVHTHWGYHHPYAARSWTLEDWRGYLSGLQALGYDLVMFWPLVDSMPARSTASDQAFLARTAQVIDMAHRQFGMKFLITLCPNVMGNEHAAEYRYEERPYFICERKVNPADPAALADMLAARRWQFEPLCAADGLVIIDGDPGGYVGSTDEQFVNLLESQIGIFRQFNPTAELVYWTWFGWENYNRFWEEAQQLTGSRAEPQMRVEPGTFTRALKGVIARIPEPWSLLGAWPQHLETTQALGLEAKRMYIPYGAIEGEPSFPLTNYTPAHVKGAFERYPAGTFPRGVMANAQTHCLQLPHTYLFSRYAQDGPACAVDLPGFAEGLLTGLGDRINAAWEAIGGDSASQQRQAARLIRKEIGKTHTTGRYAGMLFGDPDRFLLDLAMNLEVRASLADLGQAATGGQADSIKQAVRGVLQSLSPYQQRLGFTDAYGGPLEQMLNEPLSRLGDAGLDAVLSQFHDWRSPAVRNGVMTRLLSAMEQYSQ